MNSLLREIKNNVLHPDVPRWMRKKEIVPVRISVRKSELEQPHNCEICETRMKVTGYTYTFGDEVIVAARSLAFRCPRHHYFQLLSNIVLEKFHPLVKDVYTKRARTEDLQAVNAVMARDAEWRQQGLL